MVDVALRLSILFLPFSRLDLSPSLFPRAVGAVSMPGTPFSAEVSVDLFDDSQDVESQDQNSTTSISGGRRFVSSLLFFLYVKQILCDFC